MSDTRAQFLRKNMTGPERKLWSRLRLLREQGFHFRRQVPFGKYVLDFVSHRERLVVEVDGAHHYAPEHQKRDSERSRAIEERGYRVMRFSNYEVLLGTNSAVEQIVAALQERRRVKFAAAVPPPDPSPPIGSERSTAPQRGR